MKFYYQPELKEKMYDRDEEFMKKAYLYRRLPYFIETFTSLVTLSRYCNVIDLQIYSPMLLMFSSMFNA